MSPYVAAAVVGSLHQSLTAVPMLLLVMAVVSRRLAIMNTERAARRLPLPSPNGNNLVAAPVVCDKEAKRESEEREREREREKAATCEYACFAIERKSLMIGRIIGTTGH